MRRNLFLLTAIVSIAVTSCNRHDNITEEKDTKISITVCSSTDNNQPESRITITSDINTNDNWVVNWVNGDKLGGWSIGATTFHIKFNEFSMTELVAPKIAKFEGVVQAGATGLRLYYPFNNAENQISKVDSTYQINIGTQNIDMNNKANHLAQNTHMISNVIANVNTAQYPIMNHINTFIKLKMLFKLPDNVTVAKLKKINFSEKSANSVKSMAKINLSKEVNSVGFLSLISGDNKGIESKIINSPNIKSNETHTVIFTAIPFNLT